MKHLQLLVILWVMMVSVSALAQTDDFDRDVLLAYEAVPTAAGLVAAYPDARERLEAVAQDADRSMYERKRATTLMSLFADARARTFLEGLGATAENPRLRRTALYTLARTFGQRPDAALVARVLAATKDADADVRHWAARSLRWVNDVAAVRELRQLEKSPDRKLAGIARLALKRHVSLTSATPTQ